MKPDLLSIVLCLLVGAAGCAALSGPGAEYASITPVVGAGEPVAVDQTFAFEGGPETVGTVIDAGVLAGARAVPGEVLVRGEVQEEEWVAGAYRAEVLDPAQDRFYGDLIARFREIRDRRGLDADRYLELMAAAIQQFPYVSSPERAAKYPIETWADGGGDCDDRALLLAGLLQREGYRVALLLFLPESHMALGIGCPDGYDYRGTGYAYLEVTNASYIGSVPTGIRLTSAPLVVPLGNGTISYGALSQTEAIESARQEARDRMDALGPEIERRESALKSGRSRLEAMRSGADRGAFEALYTQYTADDAALGRLVEEYNRGADLLNETSASRYDRAGAAAYVSAHPP